MQRSSVITEITEGSRKKMVSYASDINRNRQNVNSRSKISTTSIPAHHSMGAHMASA